jgi:hypothetical protein
MAYGADVVAIAATTAGVTGTITVPLGAHLRNMSIGFVESANGIDVISIIELTWASSPTPLRFTPNMFSMTNGTPATGGNIIVVPDNNMLIPLDVTVQKANTVTIKVTSTGNLAVKIGLEWD